MPCFLGQMLKRPDCPLSQGIKNNLNDLKEIRDAVEHLLLRRGDAKFFSRFQACCLNFEKTLCALFGERLSLSNELSLALQFAKLDFEQLVSLESMTFQRRSWRLTHSSAARTQTKNCPTSNINFGLFILFKAQAKSRAHIQFSAPRHGGRKGNLPRP